MFVLKMVNVVVMYVATASTEPWGEKKTHQKNPIELKDRLTEIIQPVKQKEN